MYIVIIHFEVLHTVIFVTVRSYYTCLWTDKTRAHTHSRESPGSEKVVVSTNKLHATPRHVTPIHTRRLPSATAAEAEAAESSVAIEKQQTTTVASGSSSSRAGGGQGSSDNPNRENDSVGAESVGGDRGDKGGEKRRWSTTASATKAKGSDSRVGGGGRRNNEQGSFLSDAGKRERNVGDDDGGNGANVPHATDASVAATPPTKAAAECDGCGGAEGDARVDQELLEGFGVSVCRTCKV